VGIYELLVVDDEMRKLMHDNVSEQSIKAYAISQGMIDLRQDGLRWVESGVTSLEELITVTKD
jgi:general secretion pathway protein E